MYWRDSLENDQSIEGKITLALLDDLTDRRGLKQAWEGIDDEQQQVIIAKWKNIIKIKIELK